MTFSEHLRYLRGPLTQKDFSRMLGIPLTSYHRYELGERAPDINLLAQIVKCVGISADILLGLPTSPGVNTAADARLKDAIFFQHIRNKDAVIELQQEIIANLTRTMQTLI